MRPGMVASIHAGTGFPLRVLRSDARVAAGQILVDHVAENADAFAVHGFKLLGEFQTAISHRRLEEFGELQLLDSFGKRRQFEFWSRFYGRFRLGVSRLLRCSMPRGMPLLLREAYG